MLLLFESLKKFFIHKKAQLPIAEDELRQLNNRLDYILEGAGLGAWDWWLETNKVTFDRRWCEMLGLRPEDTPQELSTWDSRVHPDDKAKAYADIKTYLDGLTPYYENIHRLRHAQGHWVWILDRGRISEYDSNGKPIRFTGTHFDVTKFKEQQLLLESIQSVANIGGWELDKQTGQTRWTSQTYKIHGIPQGTPTNQIMGMNFYAPHEIDRISRYAKECLEGKSFNEVFEFIDAKSAHKKVGVAGEPVFDADGVIRKIRGTFQDLTQLIELQDQNRFILESLGVGVWKYNPTSKELNWDQSMYRLYGLDSRDFSAHYDAWEKSLSPENRIKAIEELNSALRGDRHFDTTFEIVTPNGVRKNIRGKGYVVRDDDQKPLMMFGLNWDVTAEVQLHQALDLERAKSLHSAKLASLGEISAGIAHEINNPLAIISANISLLQKFRADETKFESKLVAIQKSTLRIEKIVKALRKFSRTSDQSSLKMERLLDIVQESISLVDSRATHLSVNIGVEVDESLMIECDHLEIEQVLINLLNNAIDAVKSLETRWVLIRASAELNDIVLHVMDSGSGISPDIEEKLFQPFFTTKQVGEGTGLGLSISKGILDQHGAEISLNRSFSNTCFEIRFARPTVVAKGVASDGS